MAIFPAVGLIRPAITNSKELFPQPEGPITERLEPLRRLKVISARASTRVLSFSYVSDNFSAAIILSLSIFMPFSD
jgi:hypothetical protein